MKKKNLVILSVICILSLCAFAGLMVYAFHLQSQRNLQEQAAEQDKIDNNDLSTDASTVAPTDTVNDLTDTGTKTSDKDTSDENNSQDATALTPTVSVTDPELSEDGSGSSRPIILGFAGDVNLDESYYPVAKYDAEAQDISQCFTAGLLEEMTSADIMMLNNEFAYSTRGTKTPDKSFTFRANPSRVAILKEMGVDIVSLANNHALDYGPEALLDTFDTLENAEIDYVGAGRNMERAKAPVYRTVGNKTIAYVAASHVIFAMNWYASDTNPGMVGTYDPTLILESIKEAEANSDFVAVFVHWGVERNEEPESYQRNLAKMYIDAGADAVIGCHPHVMQGFEFYKGKPIAYSLGNYWFNASTKESGMVKLTLDPDGVIKTQLLPVMNKDTVTYLLTGKAEKKNYFDYIEGLSFDVKIDEEGYLTPAK